MNKGCDSPPLCSELGQTIPGILDSNLDMMSIVTKVLEALNFCQMRR